MKGETQAIQTKGTLVYRLEIIIPRSHNALFFRQEYSESFANQNKTNSLKHIAHNLD